MRNGHDPVEIEVVVNINYQDGCCPHYYGYTIRMLSFMAIPFVCSLR